MKFDGAHNYEVDNLSRAVVFGDSRAAVHAGKVVRLTYYVHLKHI